MRLSSVFASGVVVLALGVAGATLAQQPALDTRAPLVVTGPQKAFILTQMRLFVAAVQRISDGLATGDRAKVAEAARSRSFAAVHAMPNRPQGMENALPPNWRTFGHAAHHGFEAIGDAAEQNKSTEEILGLLAATMANCVACHQTYRLVEGEPAAR